MLKNEAALLPGDERLLPWSHNILAADAVSMYTCHSRLRCADVAGKLRFRPRALSAATHTWHSAHTGMCSSSPAHCLAWLRRLHAVVTGLHVCSGRRAGQRADVWLIDNSAAQVPRTPPVPAQKVPSSQSQLSPLRHKTEEWFINWGEHFPSFLITQ